MTYAVLLSLIGVAIVGLLLVSLLGPRESWELRPRGGLLASLRESKDRLVRSIADLREDRRSGRISEEEFERLHRRLKRRAVRRLMLLDELRSARSRQIARPDVLSPRRIRRVEDLVVGRITERKEPS